MATINLKPSTKVVNLCAVLISQLLLQITQQKADNPDNEELILWQEKLEGDKEWSIKNQDKLIKVCQSIIDEADKCVDCSDGITKSGMTRVCSRCQGSGRWMR